MPDPVTAASVLVRRGTWEGPVFLVVARTREGREWCPPGGKLEHGETAKEAAIRELREETGVVVFPEELHFVASLPHVGKTSGDVAVFFCEYRETLGVPHAAEGCPVAWQTWEEICTDVFGEFYSRLSPSIP